jgi:DNA-binding transcriptional regulator LsrR (DeoR family)
MSKNLRLDRADLVSVLYLHTLGLNQEAIARKLGMSQQSVSRQLLFIKATVETLDMGALA